MSPSDRRPGDQRRRRRRLPAGSAAGYGVLSGLLLALAVTVPVFAHADLTASNPQDQSVLATPPATITLTFSEGLDAGRSSFRLLGGGAVIGTGRAAGAGGTVMTLDGLALAPGAYEIRWTAASTDGHIERGTLTFGVASPTPAPPTPTPEPTSPPTAGASAGATASPITAAPATSTLATSDPAASPAPGGGGVTPVAASATDVVIPIVAALVAVLGIGVLVLRRSRRA